MSTRGMLASSKGKAPYRLGRLFPIMDGCKYFLNIIETLDWTDLPRVLDSEVFPPRPRHPNLADKASAPFWSLHTSKLNNILISLSLID